MASYSYSNISDFLNASTIILSELQDDITGSSISSANVLYSIESGDTITIYFDGTLSAPDQSTLTAVVNAYTTGLQEDIITTTGSFVLSNKDLITTTNFFIDPVVATKRAGFSTSGATSGTTLTLASICSTDRTITFPNITDTVVTLTATQSLTNKTIGRVSFDGQGSTSLPTSTAYFVPTSTAVTGSNNYYFTSLAAPATTGSTTGSAYTLYVAGAPSGTITTPYSLYIAAGSTYLGGALQIPTGAVNGYILTSNATGIASWTAPSTPTFADGTVSAPGIAFTNETSTGFYRPSANQLGVAVGGTLELLLTQTTATISNGTTFNVGTSGTTSPLNVYGLITGTNGLTITGANTSLTSLSTSGLISANAGLTSANGQTVNVGTSGTTSSLNIYGTIDCFGTGGTSLPTSTVYVAPASTAVTGSNNYYFTALAAPATTGSTTGSAYTLYVAGAPSGTITTPYSLYIAAGSTYLGGALQIPTGAVNGYVLTSNATGVASWAAAAIPTFADGTVGAPGIAFANQTNTGFYRPSLSQIGVAINGVNTTLFTATKLELAIGTMLNVGTSGTTSPLNVYGLITGANGLTITGANTSLTTLSTSGLISANAGVTIATGQSLNVGTSGTTSTSTFWGLTTHKAKAIVNGTGNSVATDSTLYVAPDATAVTGATNYYFSTFAAPTTTGATTGEAYTVHIAGAPTGTITNPYALYIASGRTYMGGTLRYTNGAANLRVLQSDASGDATWVDVSALPSPSLTYYYAVTTTTQDTTSTTATNIPSMTATPAAGTYYVSFAGVGRTLTGNRTFNVRLAINGTLITNAAAAHLISTINIDQRVGVDSIVTCNGTDVVTAQFWISSGSGTIRLTNHKSLVLMRVGA